MRAITGVQEADWDPSKHPRGGYPQNRGMFSKTWGPRGNQKVKAGQQPNLTALPASTVQGVSPADAPRDPAKHSHWYLPSDNKGTWSGKKGESTFRLAKPVMNVDGTVIKEIEYAHGVPNLEKFVGPHDTVSIVVTGDNDLDRQNAIKAWKQQNPGKTLPKNSVFHHDLLNVAEETIEIDKKKTRVIVGKMQLVPAGVNELVYHEGSASVARKFYQGLQVDTKAIKKLAADHLAGKHDAVEAVTVASQKIVPGRIAKGISAFVGRNVVRLIPFGLSGMALIEFTENAEAHGIGGAAARAVPVLGDLISVHDLGSQWAKQIRDEANAAMDAVYRRNNAAVDKAWDDATTQTIDAFNELAPQIEVTNDPYNNTRLSTRMRLRKH